MNLPHSITLYNVGKEDPQTYKREVNVTVITGVFLTATKSNSKGTTGATNGDTVSLHIPLSAMAVDAFTAKNKAFIMPKSYEASADHSGQWTLDTNDSFFVKGVHAYEGGDFQRINSICDDVYKISSYSIKDFGSEDMRHIEVTGR